MAIKGKSRRRSKTKGPALAPKPTISPRRTPLAQRRSVKRAAVIALAVGSILGGLRLWQNVERSDALQTYDRALLRAQAPLLQHLGEGSLTNLQQTVQQFTPSDARQRQIDGKRFREVAELWEKDFKAAKEAVEKLKPPNKVAEDAQFLIVQGLDGYVGLVRLYNLAGQVRALAEAEKVAATKSKLEDQVQVLLQHATEWRGRADAVYNRGRALLDDLKVRYGISPTLPTPGPQP